MSVSLARWGSQPYWAFLQLAFPCQSTQGNLTKVEGLLQLTSLLTCLDLLLFTLKMFFSFFGKTSYLNEEVNRTELPLQLAFTCQSTNKHLALYGQICCRKLYKMWMTDVCCHSVKKLNVFFRSSFTFWRTRWAALASSFQRCSSTPSTGWWPIPSAPFLSPSWWENGLA